MDNRDDLSHVRITDGSTADRPGRSYRESAQSLLLPTVVVAAMHVGLILVALTTQCQHASGEIVGLTCSGGVGLRGTAIALSLSLLGSPAVLWILFRRAGQAHAALLAFSAELILPLPLYVLLAGAGTSAGGFVLWEGFTQLVLVPTYVVAFGARLNRVQSVLPGNRH